MRTKRAFWASVATVAVVFLGAGAGSAACGTPGAVVAPAAGEDAGMTIPPLASSVARPPPVASASASAHAAASAAPLEPLAPDVIIDDGGVGDVRVGKPIPKRYLDEAIDPKSRYEIRWIADAQPFEAFRVGDPERLAAFDGPFMRWGRSHAGPLEPQKFSTEALRMARGTAVVTWIVVEKKGLFTRERIGVGSPYSALAAAYPGIKVTKNPEWFDSNPTCSAQSPSLPKVQFLLASCSAGGNGEVVRIVVGR